MSLEIYLNYDNGKTYKPGDTIICLIDVNSHFKIKCKYVKLRIRCPYAKNSKQIFKEYAIAKRRIYTRDNGDSYRIGDVAENIVLQSGTNRFIVTYKIPNVSDDVFGANRNEVIGCSLKVTVNVNWFPKRCCQDWFRLQPKTKKWFL